MQKLTRDSGEVYATRLFTRVALETELTLRGDEAERFELIVRGGTKNGVFVPPPPPFDVLAVGAIYLVGFHAVVSPKVVHHPWPEGTPVVTGAVLLGTTPKLDRPGFELFCGSMDAG